MITKKRYKTNPVENSFVIEIPWKIPSKKNSYQIHFAPKLWKAIKPIIDRIKRSTKIRRPYWVAPSERVKSFEKNLSTWFALYLPDFGSRPLSIEIHLNQKNDVDNIGGAVLDALEASKKIKNDRQVVSILVHRCPAAKEPVIIIEPVISDCECKVVALAA